MCLASYECREARHSNHRSIVIEFQEKIVKKTKSNNGKNTELFLSNLYFGHDFLYLSESGVRITLILDVI